MRRLLNTLYVTTKGSYLTREGETVLVRVQRETKLRVPIHNLAGIVAFGGVMCSPPLMELCAERKVGITFLSTSGRFIARLQGPVSGNVLLRREQYRRADDEQSSTAIARSVVSAKVANCRTVLLRAARERGESDASTAFRTTSAELEELLVAVQRADTVDAVRGHEGEAARLYFGAFGQLVTVPGEDFAFHGRSRRPPLDNINALLSFCYTMLAHDVASALETVGLDPAVGFLHRDRPGRPGLALDMMEELRPYIADRLVLTLVNRQQVKGTDFVRTETGGVHMSDSTRKEVIVAYQTRKQEETTHPFTDEKLPIGLLPHLQAMLLARHLRGELDGYPPFIWR